MQDTRDLFARHSLRCTRQRVLVYECLRSTDRHPTAEDLHRDLDSSDGDVSLATVYNTLEALERVGLVRRISTENGCCRFDADVTPHLHVRVRETGEILDVPEDLGSRLAACLPVEVLERIASELGVEIDEVELRLHASRATAPDPAPARGPAAAD